MGFAFTTSPTRPLSLNPGGLVFKQFPTHHHPSFIPTTTTTSLHRRRNHTYVNALKKSSTQTLSSNWDISNYSPSAPRLPRFEELDTTNMLLRQRIIFLGSQPRHLFSAPHPRKAPMDFDLVAHYNLMLKFYNEINELKPYDPRYRFPIQEITEEEHWEMTWWIFEQEIPLAIHPLFTEDKGKAREDEDKDIGSSNPQSKQVDDVSADLIISQLLFLDAEDQTKDIKLFINSPGGSVTAGMGIYDAMKLCKADVSTVCLGLAASMGAFLLASGTKGKRYCMPNARVMIHQPLGTAGGKATEMGIRIREMVYHKIKLNKIFSRVTGKPEAQIEVDTDRDNFMNPWEAKEYGLIDAVIDDGKPGLVAPIGDSTPPPKTRVWDLWKVEGSRKAKKNLPSEQKMLQNGYKGSDEQEKEAPAPV